jgi:DoxX
MNEKGVDRGNHGRGWKRIPRHEGRRGPDHADHTGVGLHLPRCRQALQLRPPGRAERNPGLLPFLHLKPAGFWALVAGLVEFGGGIAMVLGLLARVQARTARRVTGPRSISLWERSLSPSLSSARVGGAWIEFSGSMGSSASEIGEARSFRPHHPEGSGQLEADPHTWVHEHASSRTVGLDVIPPPACTRDDGYGSSSTRLTSASPVYLLFGLTGRAAIRRSGTVGIVEARHYLLS